VLETMTCDTGTEKLDAYLDGELSTDEARTVHQHLSGCPKCAAQAVAKLQQKRVIQAAGQKFAPDAAFRARIQKSIAARKPSVWSRRWLPVFATATTAALLIAVVSLLNLQHERRNDGQLMSELIDQHVATLASANPVDVVSTDRHTVKPWFEGKIPFTFNVPELQGSDFALIGGRVSYLKQSPGAELIFHVRKHQISVFIFQQRESEKENESARAALSFEVRNWSHNGLNFFVIGDASAGDLDKLSDLLKGVN
jgi:anti-sigma factor RsiW